MRRSIGLLFALPLALAACNPIVVGRTAELTPRGKLGFDYSLQTLTIEPQHIEQTDRSTLDSTVGFMPDMKLGVHGGLGRCEIGAGFPVPSAFTELRCAVAQESRGAPVSVAFGGAAGVSLAHGVEGGRPTPLGRLELDVSRRFFGVVPFLDVVLSSEAQRHFVMTGTAWGPFPVGVELTRTELRLSLPIGVAFIDTKEKLHRWYDPKPFGALFSIVPWAVLWGPKAAAVPIVTSYRADVGLAFTVGLDFR